MNQLYENVFYIGQPRIIYTGLLPDPINAELAAPMLFVSLAGPIRVTDTSTKETFESSSVLTSSCAKLSIDVTNNPVCLVVLDYLGEDWQLISADAGREHLASNQRPFCLDLSHEAELAGLGNFVWRTQPKAIDAFKFFDSWLLSLDQTKKSVSDERVAKAIELITTYRNQELNIEEIAKHVDLSVPRLSQLFKKTTGVATRRLKLWAKAHAVANYVGQGCTLPEATKIAGFSDYSHFSRTFKEISGLNPSMLFSASAQVKIQNKESFPLEAPNQGIGF